MTRNPVLHENQARVLPRTVFYEGTGALVKGQAVCYNRDTGTATEHDGYRDKKVEDPAPGNEAYFAGVTVREYSAKSAGQWIQIYEPGSICEVYCNEAVDLGDHVFAIQDEQSSPDDMGQFGKTWVGFLGRGAARILQTESSADKPVMALLLDGPQTGVVQVIDAEAGAATLNATGMTIIPTAATIASDMTATLADADVIGVRKGYQCLAALTTSDLVITVTNGLQEDGSTALVSTSLDADGEITLLEFMGSHWKAIHNDGATLAAT